MIYQATEKNIERAAEIIKSGGVVAFPTETVYGLGANIFDSLACAKIFEIKQRPFFDPLIVHIDGLKEIEKIAVFNRGQAEILATKFWPGPMTLILNKKPAVPEIVTAGLQTVAVRMPRHPVALALIKKSGAPIAAPSANVFSRLSPTSAEHVEEQLGDKVEMILDGGRCEFGVESTIIDLTGSLVSVLRFGALSVEEIQDAIGKVEFQDGVSEKPKAPGQLAKHYSPKTKLKIIDSRLEIKDSDLGKKVGLLAFKKPERSGGFAVIEILSETGDLKQAAANLFVSLRRLDSQNLDLIYAESVPEIGLGKAIMDRLKRAQTP